MRFGVNMLLFGDVVDSDVMGQFSALRDIGFDVIEVPVLDPGALDVDAVRGALEREGLGVTASGIIPGGTRFYGDDTDAVKRAHEHLERTIDAAAALGARVLCGPLYKAVGDVDESLPLDEQRAQTARAMAPLAARAAEKGVTLALEPLNRFETNLVNTVAQGIAFCRAIGSSAAGLLLDTFHMHIEEKDSASAVAAAAEAGVAAHFHASENDRGTAGSGQVHWREVAAALSSSRYDGAVVLESFTQTSQAIRTAVSCWRPFYTTREEFLRDGLAFARRTFDAHARERKG